MGIYVGPVPPGPGIVNIKMCFTGLAATVMKNVIAQVAGVSTALIGAAIGFVVSIFLGPEVIPQIAGIFVGAAAGAVAGGLLTAFILARGACPCPPGASGFCIVLVFYVVPGTSVWIPIWPFAFPDPGACATVMPAGCP